MQSNTRRCRQCFPLSLICRSIYSDISHGKECKQPSELLQVIRREIYNLVSHYSLYCCWSKLKLITAVLIRLWKLLKPELEVFRKDDRTVEGVVTVVVLFYVLIISQFIYFFTCEKVFDCIVKYNINSWNCNTM